MGSSASVSKFSQDVNFESLDETQLENAVKGLQTGQLSCLERMTKLSEPSAKIVQFIIWFVKGFFIYLQFCLNKKKRIY